ncbi:MAG: clan AA aspartic protease [Thermoanaerobacteraceae bacterium]|nr:clan AA aspartic protease [Thermoanaerobacteraceae bacterium]
MGHVYVNAQLEGTKGMEMVTMLVDTGATLSAIPENLAERIGVPKLGPKKVQLANGQEFNVQFGVVNIKINGREAPTTVLIVGNEPLLGVETLETLGLKVNPLTGGLEPSRSFALRLGFRI